MRSWVLQLRSSISCGRAGVGGREWETLSTPPPLARLRDDALEERYELEEGLAAGRPRDRPHRVPVGGRGSPRPPSLTCPRRDPHRDRGPGHGRAPLVAARRQGAADRNAMTSRVDLGCQRAPELLEHNASQEDTRGGGFNSDDSTLPASPVAGFGSRLREPVSACDRLTFLSICSSASVSLTGGSMPLRN